MATVSLPGDVQVSISAADLKRVAAYRPASGEAATLTTRKSVARTMLYHDDPAIREQAWRVISGEEG